MRAPLGAPTRILRTLVLLFACNIPFTIAAYAQARTQGGNTPQTISAILVQARQLIEHNKLAEARQLLSDAVNQFPHEAALLNYLGVVDAKEHNLETAESDFRKAISESPSYAGPYLNLGRLYQDEIGKRPGAVSAAIRTYQRLHSADPGNVEALNELAMLYERTGHLSQARSMLQKAFISEPHSVPLLLELARVANWQRDYRGALGYLAHARTLEPGNAHVHFFFGMVCVEMELHRDAYASLKKAVALDPGNPYYNYALGAVLATREDPREAIPYFEKYCELRPSDPRGTLALGEAFYYGHDLKVARTKLAQVANENVTAAGANYYLGRIAKDEEKWREAARYFSRAIQYNPRYADAYAMLGDVYLKEKRYTDSTRALQHALNLDSHNYFANLWLTTLYERTSDPRAEAQAQRFSALQKAREERTKLFLRTIQVVP